MEENHSNHTLVSEEISGTLLGEIFTITPEEIEQANESLAGLKTGEEAIEVMHSLEKKIYALIYKKAGQKVTKGSLNTVLNEDMELLRKLMFFLVRRRLDLARLNIGVRTDFQLVYRTEVRA